MNVPNTYVEGELNLTFTSIAKGSVPIRQTYDVPLVSYTVTEFTKVLLTKDHPTAPLKDGAYKLFVDYTMRKDQKPRNASVHFLFAFCFLHSSLFSFLFSVFSTPHYASARAQLGADNSIQYGAS
jgi:hypothetical protein